MKISMILIVLNLRYYFILFIFLFISHTNDNFPLHPLFPFPHSVSPLPLPPFTPLPFRKEQTFHGSQQSLTCQDEAVPSSLPCIKPYSMPAWGTGSTKPANVPGTEPDPTARGPSNRTNCVPISQMQRT